VELQKKDQTPRKVQLPGQERFQTHGKRERKISAPQSTPMHKLSMTSMVWIYFHWVSHQLMLPPAHQ